MKGFGTPPADAPAPNGDMQKGQPASPELQAEYNKFVGLGLKALSEKSFITEAEKVLKASPNVANAMAQIGSTVAAKILASAREQGQRISPEVLVHGGLELMQQIGEMATAAGVPDVTEETVETAYFLAADTMNDQMAEAGAMEDYQVEDMDQFMQNVPDDKIAGLRERVGSARQAGIMGGGV